MMPRRTQFQYRAWPSKGMPHVEALHHMFGLGVAEIRIDTHILSPNHPHWQMILRGGTQFEIKVRDGIHGEVSAWTTVMQSAFPLRHNVVCALQEAFPAAQLPSRISAPADLISWLGGCASICTVSKRMVHFKGVRGTAELTQVDTLGRRVETFCLKASRLEAIVQTLDVIPGPRLPDTDYGSWLARRIPPVQATPPILAAPVLPVVPTAHIDRGPLLDARLFKLSRSA